MMHRILVIIAAVSLIAASPRADDDAKKELAKLGGTWSLASYTINGVATNETYRSQFKLVVKGAEYTMTRSDTTYWKATFKLDPTKKPKKMDLVLTEGKAKGMTLPGIYDIDGDTLTICLTSKPDDKTHPKEFSSKEDSDTILQVWRRIKP